MRTQCGDRHERLVEVFFYLLRICGGGHRLEALAVAPVGALRRALVGCTKMNPWYILAL